MLVCVPIPMNNFVLRNLLFHRGTFLMINIEIAQNPHALRGKFHKLAVVPKHEERHHRNENPEYNIYTCYHWGCAFSLFEKMRL